MNPRHTTELTVHLHQIGPGGLARPSLLFDCIENGVGEFARLVTHWK